jgi:hypothetical protein
MTNDYKLYKRPLRSPDICYLSMLYHNATHDVLLDRIFLVMRLGCCTYL